VVVSDHGFTNVQHEVNLFPAFIAAGFIRSRRDPDSDSVVFDEWRAEPWIADGMAAIMLKDPNDAQTREAVKKLLDRLAADPGNGIEAVKTQDQLAATGGFPGASFLVQFKPGFAAGERLSGEITRPLPAGIGTHGFSPEHAEMRSSFFVAGKGIAQGRDLGIIDMRQIAPTVAHILGVELPHAHGSLLRIEP
jgi:hypothetical protein